MTLAFTPDMGASLTYELLDEVVSDQLVIFEWCEKQARHTPFSRAKSRVWWAIKILRKMEAKGLVPKGLWFEIQAQQSIALSDWVYSHIQSKGIPIEERKP